MTAQLYDWQVPLAKELSDKFEASKVVLCALPTGTGKTYITTDIMKKSGKKFLVICPKSIIGSWKSVLADFELPEEQCLGILNPEKLRTGNTPWFSGTTNAWQLPDGAAIVWDEPHKGASGYDSRLTEILALTKAWKIPMILQSATIADSPLKLRAAGYLLGLHGYKTADYFRWCANNGCRFDTDYRYWRYHGGHAGMAEIRKRIVDKCVYYPLSKVPGFPEVHIEAKLFDLEAKYTKEYNEIYAELEYRLATDNNANKFTEMLRARQKAEALKVPLLLDLVQERLDEGLSVVVFLNFLDTLNGLMIGLSANEVNNVSTIHGGQSQAERDEEIRKFQDNENHVCLCMIQAGGVGISLHDVKQARMRFAYVCPSYSASDVKQALGRIHRAGGTKAVQVFPLAAGTIEERVYRSIRRKLSNIEALNDSDFEM